MRIVPGTDPERELDALVTHLESHAPWGAHVEVQRTKAAPPFTCRSDGPAYAAALLPSRRLSVRPVGNVGSGASIPLLGTLQKVAPAGRVHPLGS